METKLAEGKEKFRMFFLLLSLSQHLIKSWLPKTKVFITVELEEKLIFMLDRIFFKSLEALTQIKTHCNIYF